MTTPPAKKDLGQIYLALGLKQTKTNSEKCHVILDDFKKSSIYSGRAGKNN